MDKTTLYDLLKRDEHLNRAELGEVQSLIVQYPYFQTARLIQLKNWADDESNPDEFPETLGKTALFCADRRKLFYLIKKNRYGLFFNTEDEGYAGKDRTEELLDTFLDSLTPDEEKLPIPHTEQNVVLTDYLSFAQLDNTEQSETQPLKHHDIIDDFIQKSEEHNIFSAAENPAGKTPSKSNETIEIEDDGGAFLTETLARIYIKQRKYEQALTIIKRLSLNFPKKSVYFADQIRFLEYLIVNEKNKK